MVHHWAAAAGMEVTLPLSAVIAFYRQCMDGVSSTDARCSMLTVLKRWRQVGFGSHTIQGFVQLEPNNPAQVKDAISLLGAAYLGIALPNFAITGDPSLTAWVVPPQGPIGDGARNSDNGHCVAAVAYDSRSLYVVSWGRVKAMSWPFYDAYVDEGYAALSPDWLEVHAATAARLDLPGLRRDIRRVGTLNADARTGG
jgi:hypothetical protein